MRLWVDTDFGFDDLWALLLLRANGVRPEGISLVAGNAPLERVTANALGAVEAFGSFGPLYAGASRPLQRPPEDATAILGSRGMRSRGEHLPEVSDDLSPLPDAVSALSTWATVETDRETVILALGPLTNLARLHQEAPEAYRRVSRIIWMGGANGPGNHTPLAEFNAFADPEAAALVAASPVPLTILDLEACRQARFSEERIPELANRLLADLLRGYLDIALDRGRRDMAIYDPLAALALVAPDCFHYDDTTLDVCLEPGPAYGRTLFSSSGEGPHKLAVGVAADAAERCLASLQKVPA